MVTISLVPLNADLSIEHMALMGGALALAVLVPWLVSRYLYDERIIKFPVNTGRPWPLAAKLYGGRRSAWILHPPGIPDPDRRLPQLAGRLRSQHLLAPFPRSELRGHLGRTVLHLHHFHAVAPTLPRLVGQPPASRGLLILPVGDRLPSPGPLLTFPFALLQGYTFKLTKSFTYVVSVHLLFDFVLFTALVHAHNRDWLPIFLY